ncbi:Cc-nbs-lrr resistance-like protein [Theobroma cacao]|uniref:Cc-nbs-lrr resistance-like protein n=1 Tax=Theobroma cacao TaxID=3641 RepID=A0A061F2I9_THECC|nr:Cc-nbs-lrr resistance-like protein [Theobroma cacao]
MCLGTIRFFLLSLAALPGSSTNSQAKSLLQVTRMTITDCEMIKETIACECDEVKRGIVFTQLKYLQLSGLPTLASFCLGDHNFEFPALGKMIVRECPKMKIFCQGYLSTPQLQKVIWTKDEDEENGWWEGDLKTTITRMFEEKVSIDLKDFLMLLCFLILIFQLAFPCYPILIKRLLE